MSDMATREQMLRKILFVPCTSKTQLHNWIQIFLGIDLPDGTVDPESNSSPMDMVWETYTKAHNNHPDFNRVLFYASRDSFKTLGAAILELLVVLHLGRNVAHMAAIQEQSGKSQQYVKGFLARPLLRDYLIGDNEKTTWVLRYNNPKTGENLTKTQFQELSEEEKNEYVENKNYIKVVVCTMQGANSEHVPFFVIDEVDVVPNAAAYEEAKMIPSQSPDGKLPITLLTSTRKFSFGLVQKEIDNQLDQDGERRLHIRHWNLIDVTQACPPERHLPHRVKLPIYVNDDQLRAISEKQYQALAPVEQEKFKKEEGYEGCLSNCRIFAACRGRLATEQKSKSKLLRSIAHTQNQFRTVSVATARAQLLCSKPSTEGLIYPNFERPIHMLTAAQMAEKILGTPFKHDLTKGELLAILKQREVAWHAGMDFGYTHNFAVVTGCVDGYRAFVVDVISQPELLPDQQVQVCDAKIKHLNPVIWADPENRQLRDMLRKSGYRMRDWFKEKGSVVGGIDIVRMRLRPPAGEPLLYFLADDPGCELLAKRISQYHWALDQAGRPSDVPDDKDDDECDALRYFIMNVFRSKGELRTAPEHDTSSAQATPEGVYTQENWLSKWKQENGIDVSEGGQSAGKKGSFRWNI